MGMTVGVVGATGTVGRAIAQAFRDNGNVVRAIGRGEPFDGVDVLVNAAGSCWGLTDEQLEEQHVRLVHRILDALDGTPLVHIGSIHEYGPVPRGTLIDENVPPNPVTPYARAKLAGSQAVLAAGGVVLRAANVIGPHTGRNGFLAALLQPTVTVVESKRDYLDVRDLATAVVLASRVAGRVINVGSGVATDLRDLARMVPGERTIVDGPAVSNGGEWTCVDIRLARRLLGWHPRYSLAESVQALWSTR